MIPGLFGISLLSFLLVIHAPLDPLGDTCPTDNFRADPSEVADCRQREMERLHLNWPPFYLSLEPRAVPDTIHRLDPDTQAAARAMLARYGHWPSLANLYALAEDLKTECVKQYNTSAGDKKDSWWNIYQLMDQIVEQPDPQEMERLLTSIDTTASSISDSTLAQQLRALRATWVDASQAHHSWRAYVPKLVWHGTANRYHHWVGKVLTDFDFGESLQSEASATKTWGDALSLTLRFTLISLILAYGWAVPLGLWMARRSQGRETKALFGLLSGLEALPSFALGTLLILTLSNPKVLNWVRPLFDQDVPASMILPLVTYVLGALTTLTLITRYAALQVLNQDFIRTAKAKGLSIKQVMWRHVFPHTLIPLITTLSLNLPVVFVGSAVIERLFEINGVSREILRTFELGLLDLGMFMLVFSVSIVATLVGYLLGDILQSLVDPRIRLHTPQTPTKAR